MKKLLMLLALLTALLATGCEDPVNIDKPMVVTKIAKKGVGYLYTVRGDAFSNSVWEYTEFYSKEKRFEVSDTLSLYELHR